MGHALVIVDVQHDFCEGGALPVDGGNGVATRVAEYVLAKHDSYDAIAATQDWHIDPGSHWSDNPDFVDSWPTHCPAHTHGAQLHDALTPALQHVDAIFRKGHNNAAYSGFEGVRAEGQPVSLEDWLRAQDITHVDVCGLATDYCVRATALDAARLGFTTTLLTDLAAGVAAETTQQTLVALRGAGVTVS